MRHIFQRLHPQIISLLMPCHAVDASLKAPWVTALHSHSPAALHGKSSSCIKSIQRFVRADEPQTRPMLFAHYPNYAKLAQIDYLQSGPLCTFACTLITPNLASQVLYHRLQILPCSQGGQGRDTFQKPPTAHGPWKGSWR